MPSPLEPQIAIRRGVVAVIRRADRLLVIRRALNVEAPGAFCFPGGASEGQETEPESLQRELREELGVAITPQRYLWECTTPWEVHLSWWLAGLEPTAVLVPNPREVAEVHWLTLEEMAQLPELLISNHRFLQALQRGEFSLDAPRH